MSFSSNIPDSAVEYILLQRPSCGLDTSNKFQIKENYINRMKTEYYSFKEFLPDRCTSILDIGCGLSGVDLFLNNHYSNNIDFYLLDKTKIDEEIVSNNGIRHAFDSKGEFYNSLTIAKEILTNNNIATHRVHLHEANDQNTINVKENVDLVLSMLSWGFFYPIATYLEDVYNNLNDGGVLILDIRRENETLDKISQMFDTCEIVFERDIYKSGKTTRICATK